MFIFYYKTCKINIKKTNIEPTIHLVGPNDNQRVTRSYIILFINGPFPTDMFFFFSSQLDRYGFTTIHNTFPSYRSPFLPLSPVVLEIVPSF